MMKTNFKFKLALLALLLSLSYSCENEELEVPLETIEINTNDFLLAIDEVKQIVVNASPGNATQNVSWSSSDENVAQIQFNENGRVAGVKGLSLGSATLTAKSNNGTVMKSINVQVIVKVEKIELVEEPINDPSKTKYNVVFTPADATFQTVVWSSSDSSVISVSSNGEVTAISPGVAVITATSEEGAKTASVELNASGNPTILGLQYCSISGTGGYNADTITTTGADVNLNYSGSQPAGNYELSTEKLVVATDTQFSMGLTQSNNWSKSKVWIDWNGDKDFEDAGELVAEFGLDSQLNNGPFNGSITVPSSAALGVTRMRVQTLDAWVNYGLCGDVANQTTKDFEVEILGVSYCAITGTGGYNADTVVTTGANSNLNYSGSQPAGNYEFFTAETLEVTTGSSFTLDISQSNNWSKTKVWIDWNGDGDFEDADELVAEFGLDNQLNDGPFSGTVSIPNSATKGNTRMRVQTLDAWVTHGLCGAVDNQTTKDFKVTIL
ncbi:Ig-like domain-containing protein [Polaribacter batillariae]|uniref:Ig-like domain-containing protein n=1 Tax=Polaribacter batillariae TaxID=2808900 RepID=A0ABX7T132_9FLAO|nr:GEVED domain-containing protein [Polaribacter batillariae]QTD38971.1 Ig-like domain-containing protein [Polaribacter batillariae]